MIAGVVGVVMGGLAGYWGGSLDELLMRCSEFIQIMPRFFLALIAAAFFGPSLQSLILLLGLTSWPVTARLMRGEVLRMRALDYVTASRALGARDGHVFMRGYSAERATACHCPTITPGRHRHSHRSGARFPRDGGSIGRELGHYAPQCAAIHAPGVVARRVSGHSPVSCSTGDQSFRGRAHHSLESAAAQRTASDDHVSRDLTPPGPGLLLKIPRSDIFIDSTVDNVLGMPLSKPTVRPSHPWGMCSHGAIEAG